MHILRPHPRAPDSEPLSVGTRNLCFNNLTKVYRPLLNLSTSHSTLGSGLLWSYLPQSSKNLFKIPNTLCWCSWFSNPALLCPCPGTWQTLRKHLWINEWMEPCGWRALTDKERTEAKNKGSNYVSHCQGWRLRLTASANVLRTRRCDSSWLFMTNSEYSGENQVSRLGSDSQPDSLLLKIKLAFLLGFAQRLPFLTVLIFEA